MFSIERTIRDDDQTAAVLPVSYPSLAAKQINIRAGELSMIAGPPGAGKSTLALALALRAKVPTLYFSADTTKHTMRLRLLMMLTGLTLEAAELMMHDDREWAKQVLQESRHIGWCWDSAPSLRDVEHQIAAFNEYWGTDPQLIVFDNLIDATFESGDEYSSMRALMREFKWFARDTNAVFLVLHHTSESVPGNPCPPRHALHGKVAQTPAMILTVTGDTAGFMGVAAVKNRYGPARSDGSDPVWLQYDPATMQITDLVSDK